MKYNKLLNVNNTNKQLKQAKCSTVCNILWNKHLHVLTTYSCTGIKHLCLWKMAILAFWRSFSKTHIINTQFLANLDYLWNWEGKMMQQRERFKLLHNGWISFLVTPMKIIKNKSLVSYHNVSIPIKWPCNKKVICKLIKILRQVMNNWHNWNTPLGGWLYQYLTGVLCA